MADVNRGSRPLSPHLTIYKLPLTARMSILHRITGVGLALGAILVVWWFSAAARSPRAFDFADWVLTSWLGGLVLIGLSACFWYHFCNGLRHLFWDVGAGFELDQAHRSNIAVLAGAGVMTVITLIVALV
jgi:succinate dehydrogenase / fumarate reductase, cytochrome b subunit